MKRWLFDTDIYIGIVHTGRYRYDIDHLGENYYLLSQKNVYMVIMSCSHVRAVKKKKKKKSFIERRREWKQGFMWFGLMTYVHIRNSLVAIITILNCVLQ